MNASWRYLDTENGDKLFTAVSLPEKTPCPTIIYRSPYVDITETMTEDEIAEKADGLTRRFVPHGYAIVWQHCRGRGKSTGEHIPFIYEHEDGIALRNWVRKQPFYNGELYLWGASYLTTVHFASSPYEDDIKGAVLEVMTSEVYDLIYRNGFMRMGLFAIWYAGMYKAKQLQKQKHVSAGGGDTFPMTAYPKAVFEEEDPFFDAILHHPDRDDPFWNKDDGLNSMKNAIRDVKFPVLLISGFFDIFCEGVFRIWREMTPETRARSAMIVHSYDHSGFQNVQPIEFPGGSVSEKFGFAELEWFDHIRGKNNTVAPAGKITYYRLFENRWAEDDTAFANAPRILTYPLSNDPKPIRYLYNPTVPARFNGGLSTCFGGTAWQDKPGIREDILNFFTPEFTAPTFIKGKPEIELTVSSDRPDTCFYARISLDKKDGAYGLRDDITNIVRFCPDYVPGEKKTVHFTFDEIAFQVSEGERIRIDISSSAECLFSRHSNQKGMWCEQTETPCAHNTVYPAESHIILFAE